MKKVYRVLGINPGGTSTKIAVYDNEQPVFEMAIRHSGEELAKLQTWEKQYKFRENLILDILKDKNISLFSFDAIVARGGLVKPISAGTYVVGQRMLEDLRLGVSGKHASNLGGHIAYDIAEKLDIPSFVVDPVVVDELTDIARVTGLPEVKRSCVFHALNQRAVARRVAKEMNKVYEMSNFIVAHLGDGITIGAHEKGRVIDVKNALAGEGTFTPSRSGGMPVRSVVNLCYSGKYTKEDMEKKMVGNGGLIAHLGTNDIRQVETMIQEGDEYAAQVYEAMAYNISKEIGSYGTVLKGKVDAIILTGGIANAKQLVNWITERVGFIAPVVVSPGEDELRALAEGALRVLSGEEKAKIYDNDVESAQYINDSKVV